MPDLYDHTAPKKNTNLSVNADLLGQAKALGVNLSATLEERLAEIVAKHRRAAWLEENREALEGYNERIERDGAFSDGKRSF